MPGNAQPFAAGMLVAGKYRLRGKIGQGASGEVYLAEQIALGRQVALKVLRSEHATSLEMIERMTEEARLLAAVEHEHIVRVIDVGRTEDNRAFIVLEYVDGISFDRLVAENGSLPWRWAADAVVQILSALSALHDRNFLHLDIKPANCLNAGRIDPLSQTPRTKLVDFGIAKLVGTRGDGGPIGTPAYWSPEQALGHAVDVRADLYCVGATLYDLLTGKPPNRAALRPPSGANPGAGIPPEIDEVVRRSLALNPADRHPSARELAEDLRRAIQANAVPDTLVSGAGKVEGLEPSAEPVAYWSSDDQQLATLRKKVETFWVTGVLGATVEPLTLARQRQTLELEWVAGLGEDLQAGRPMEIAPDVGLYDLYSEHGQSLLILGGPGAGKTTQLLMLARELLKKEQRAVAVVFALSAWAQRALSLDEWMVEELQAKYQVPRRLGRAWIEGGRIIPLLDGMDDVRASQRDACIRSINDYVERTRPSPAGVVVTCRHHEYAACAARLAFGAAVRLHPLDDDSVFEYLGRYVDAGDKRRTLLSGELAALTKMPLGLTLLASLDPKVLDRLESDEVRDAPTPALWDAYVGLMLARSGKRRLHIPARQMVRTLSDLARAMKRQGISIFHLDDLQPSVLPHAWMQTAYFLASRLAVAAVWGAGAMLAMGESPLDNFGWHADIRFGLKLGLATTVGCGLVHGIATAWRARARVDTIRAHWVRVVILSVLGGIVTSAILGSPILGASVLAFETGVFAGPLLSRHAEVGHAYADIRPVEPMTFSLRKVGRTWPYVAMVAFVGFLGIAVRDLRAMTVVVIYAVLMWFFLTGLRARTVDRALPNAAIKRSLRTSSLLALVGFVLTALAMGAIYGAFYGVCTGICTAAIFWIWFGGAAAIEHGLLRLMLWLNGESFCDLGVLDAAANRGLLHRIGPGYIFVHPTLLDRLSERSTDAREEPRLTYSQADA